MKKLLNILFLMAGFYAHSQTTMNIYQNNGTVLQIPLSSIDSITYTIGNPGQLATLTTLPVGNIANITATSGGNITNNGGSPVTQRGVVWSTSPNPTTANNQSNDGSGTGNYTSTLTGLTASTTYYVRAYATNSAGTAYGNELSFTTTGGAGSITALNCASATNNGTLTAGLVASGVSSIVPYTGGNGGTHNGQTVTSTGVTGLTASLAVGTFANGSGSLTYTITGTAATSGTANFSLNIGGQNCTLSRTVNAAGVAFNGYIYQTVQIGTQTWMAENLRTTKYRNGDFIPNVTDPNQWAALTTGAWAHYDNNSQYENPYGILYNWFAVNDSRNVCPTGWHVPSDAEWSTFINYLDPNANGGISLNTAGGKMKSTGTQYWQSSNQNATNESGFSGLPGGYRTYYDGSFYDIGFRGNWWSSTENDASSAWTRYLYSYDVSVYRASYFKGNGFSVRCLRD